MGIGAALTCTYANMNANIDEASNILDMITDESWGMKQIFKDRGRGESSTGEVGLGTLHRPRWTFICFIVRT